MRSSCSWANVWPHCPVTEKVSHHRCPTLVVAHVYAQKLLLCRVPNWSQHCTPWEASRPRSPVYFHPDGQPLDSSGGQLSAVRQIPQRRARCDHAHLLPMQQRAVVHLAGARKMEPRMQDGVASPVKFLGIAAAPESVLHLVALHEWRLVQPGAACCSALVWGSCTQNV